MPREKSDRTYVKDMIEFARQTMDFTSGLDRNGYGETLIVRRAVERTVELIGEAAKYVSDELRALYPDIPWRRIVGQRNILVHDYGEVDDDLVWNLVESELPSLIVKLERVVREEPES
ncbi:MAG TPA: HepT-like ribonuclease domain-containing protein [Rhodothermales bacterium]|nr:HepT-like ribonuclease domain-containing protein [Rhodothermales bacterium]